MPGKVIIVFDGPFRIWNPGDVAGFSPERAAQILAMRRLVQGRDAGTLAHRATEQELAAVAARSAPKPPAARRVVKFTTHFGPYSPGETASFPVAVAEKYVNGWRDAAGRRRAPVAVDPGDGARAPARSPAAAIAEDLGRLSMSVVTRRAEAAAVKRTRGMSKEDLIAAVAEAEAAGGRQLPDGVEA